jgi:N-acetylglutamate synthase-like GNAT family acetyltransferase
VPAHAKKIWRRRVSGDLTVEQTHDAAIIDAMLHRAAIAAAQIGHLPECFLIAYLGDEPVGIAGLETEVDVALVAPFFVVENMRRRRVGTHLLSAVRLAAHTRGARTLYVTVPSTYFGYFARFGFAMTSSADLVEVSRHVSMRIRLDNVPQCGLLRLDLSGDAPAQP